MKVDSLNYTKLKNNVKITLHTENSIYTIKYYNNTFFITGGYFGDDIEVIKIRGSRNYYGGPIKPGIIELNKSLEIYVWDYEETIVTSHIKEIEIEDDGVDIK